MAAGFSLYSTDSDDIISSTHHGLDRCTSLMQTLLNSKRQKDHVIGAVCQPDYTHSPTSTTHLPRTHHKHHRRSKTDPGTSTASAPCLNRTGITKKKKTVEEKRLTVPQRLGKVTVTTRKGQTTRKISTRNVRIMKAPSEPVTQPNTSKPGKGLLRIPLRTRQVHETKWDEKTMAGGGKNMVRAQEENDDDTRSSEQNGNSSLVNRSLSLPTTTIPHPLPSSMVPPVYCYPPHPSYSGLPQHPWHLPPQAPHFPQHPLSFQPPNLLSYPPNLQFYPPPPPPPNRFSSFPTLDSRRDEERNPPASKDTAFYPSQQHEFTTDTQGRRGEYSNPVTSSTSKELCNQGEEIFHKGQTAVESQENACASSAFPNCPISSSGMFVSQQHDPDSIYQYYTQPQSSLTHPKVTFSLPPSWRDRTDDSVSDSGGNVTSAGGSVVCEGDPVAAEMREVLVCVVEQLEGVVKNQTSSDGDRSEVVSLVLAHLHSLTDWLSPHNMPTSAAWTPHSTVAAAAPNSTSSLDHNTVALTDLLRTRENELHTLQLEASSQRQRCQSLEQTVIELKEQFEKLLNEKASSQKREEQLRRENSCYVAESSTYQKNISELQTRLKANEGEWEREREEKADQLQMTRLSLAEKETELLHCQDRLLGFRQYLAQILIEVTPLSIPDGGVAGGCGCVPRHCLSMMQQLVNTGTIQEEQEEEERPKRELSRDGEDRVADLNDFSSDNDTLSAVTNDGSVMVAPDSKIGGSEKDPESRKEAPSQQHGGQDTELPKQRLSRDNSRPMFSQPKVEKQVKFTEQLRDSQKLSLTEQEVHDMTTIDLSFNNSSNEQSDMPSTLTRARRASDRGGDGTALTMSTTTSSELEFRRDLAALDADIARLQVHFQVTLQPSQAQ